LAGDGDTTEQQEPLLSESQDESLTLLGHPDSSTHSEEDKNGSIVNVNDDLDESITPLLGDEDSNSRNEVMNY
jgi:hypothetical protein